MRQILLALAGAASVALAQDLPRAERAVVHIQVDDRAKLKAEELLEKRAPLRQLQGLRIHQPYTMLVCGFAISPHGEIVTPALHPRANLRIVVTFHGGKEVEASVVGTDPRSNIALIRVPRETRDFLELNEEPPPSNQPVDICGPCLRLKTKDPVRLRGYVNSEQVSVNMRDLYGLTRTGRIRMGSVFGIVTTGGAPHAGAPCLDTAGNVLGIVMGSLPPRQVPDAEKPGQMTTVSVHFVTPAARIARIVGQLRERGHVVRAHFGIDIAPVPPSVRAHFDLPRSASTIVKVRPDGPAARAGLRRNDIIVNFGGKNYADTNQLGEAMSDHAPGKAVAFEVLRRGQRRTITATPTAQR